MREAADVLLDQVLALSPEDRAKVASGILASLDQPEEDRAVIERLWSQESERRASEITSGEVVPTTWDHLLERIDAMRTGSG